MKKHLIIYLTGFLCLAAACSDDDGATDPWAGGIELSAETVTFGDGTLSQTVYVENGQGGWCITAVTADGNQTRLSQAEQESLRGGAAFERTFGWLTVAVADNAITLTASGSDADGHTFGIDLQAGYSTARIIGSMPATGERPLAATPDFVDMAFWGDTVAVETNKDTWWVKSVQMDDPWKETLVALYEFDTPEWAPGTRPQEWTFSEWCDWLKVTVDGQRLVLSSEGCDWSRDFYVTLTTGSEECTVAGHTDEFLTGASIPTGVIAVEPGNVEFGAEGGEANVNVISEKWHLYDVTVDGKRYYIGHKESGEPTADRVYKRTLRWLTVEIAGLDLKLTAEPNTTGEDRTFEIVVEAYYKNGTITGVQKGQ